MRSWASSLVFLDAEGGWRGEGAASLSSTRAIVAEKANLDLELLIIVKSHLDGAAEITGRNPSHISISEQDCAAKK